MKVCGTTALTFLLMMMTVDFTLQQNDRLVNLYDNLVDICPCIGCRFTCCMIGLDTSWGTLKVDGLTATINC